MLHSHPGILIRMKTWAIAARSFRDRLGIRRTKSADGQAMLELVMTTGFLVAIAVVLNKMLGPVVLQAFEKIAKALSSVGP